jgi:hypothetical protein
MCIFAENSEPNLKKGARRTNEYPFLREKQMIRKLALLASLAAMIATAACADMTGPHRDCGVTNGSNTCDGSTGGH